MKSFQDLNLVFILRFWIEPREGGDQPLVWRGVIETVGSQAQDMAAGVNFTPPARRAFSSLDEMTHFLIRHLEQNGIPPEQLREKP